MAKSQLDVFKEILDLCEVDFKVKKVKDEDREDQATICVLVTKDDQCWRFFFDEDEYAASLEVE